MARRINAIGGALLRRGRILVMMFRADDIVPPLKTPLSEFLCRDTIKKTASCRPDRKYLLKKQGHTTRLN